MTNSADAFRRWLGMFCLAVASGLLIWGQTILKPYLSGLLFIGYWLACLGFTLAAIVTALLDMQATRRRSRAERRELLERTLAEIEAQARDAAEHPPTSAKSISKP